MARRGAFGLALKAREVAEAIYVKLGAKDGGDERPLDFNGKRQKEARRSLSDVAEEHFPALVSMLNQFRDGTTRLSAAALSEIRGEIQRL